MVQKSITDPLVLHAIQFSRFLSHFQPETFDFVLGVHDEVHPS